MRIRWRGPHAALLSRGLRSSAIAGSVTLLVVLLCWGFDLGRQIVGVPAEAASSASLAALQHENALLARDLADVAMQLPADGPAIRRVSAERMAPNRLRYHVLLVHGASGANGKGRHLLLAVSGERGGKAVTLAFPSDPAARAFALAPGPVQRFDGVLALPDGLAVTSISARVIEQGQVRTEHTLALATPEDLSRH